MNNKKIEEKIGYTFRDGALLERAFTHASASVRDNYQNLEFLGDSVLGFIVSRTLYSEYADTDEGSLTKMRAAVVSERPLAAAIDRLGVAEELITGESEKKNGVSDHSSVKCDLFESLTAAIYLDGGLDEAEKFVLGALSEEIAAAADSAKRSDANPHQRICDEKGRFRGIPRREAHGRSAHARVHILPSARRRGRGRGERHQQARGAAGGGKRGARAHRKEKTQKIMRREPDVSRK